MSEERGFRSQTNPIKYFDENTEKEVKESISSYFNLTEEPIYKFLSYLTKLKLIEFMGIARSMCIPLTKTINGKQEIKDFNELLENIADIYCMLKRRQRRELYFIVKKSVEIDEKKGDKNA